MGNSFINVNVHLVFHVKSTGCTMRDEDLPRVFHYIGGVIGSLSAHSYMVGGCVDHVHILTSLPVTMSLAELVRAVKANSSRWIKGLDAHYNVFPGRRDMALFPLVSQIRQQLLTILSISRSITANIPCRKSCRFS